MQVTTARSRARASIGSICRALAEYLPCSRRLAASGLNLPIGIRLADELKDFSQAGVIIAVEARHRPISLDVDAQIVRIDDAVAHVQTGDLADAQAPFAAYLERQVVVAFERDRRAGNVRHRHRFPRQ